jgi:hypothetical protein
MEFMNELNLKLQGKGLFAYDMYGSVKGFMNKLQLLSNHLKNKQLAHFPTLQKITPSNENLKKYSATLMDLHDEFSRRFQDFKNIENDLSLISSPFSFDVNKAPLETQLELIDMQCDLVLSEKIKSVSLPRFYASLSDSAFPNLKTRAKKMFVLFGSTYICEQTFSLMKFNKSTNRSAMTDRHLEEVLRIATTETIPNFDHLVRTQKNHQSSH